MAKGEEGTPNVVLELISAHQWAMVPIGLLFLWIGIGYLWNNKVRSIRTSQNVPTAPFNSILGRVLKFVFIEDKYPTYLKDDKGEPTTALKYPKFGKFLVWRNFYFIGFIVSTVLTVLGNGAAPFFFIATLLVILSRTGKVFSARHQVLTKMFEVAASNMAYPREANMNPWRWVNIRSWEQLTVPSEIHVKFPNKYKSDEIKNREAFERHFNGTITEDNTWIYTWMSAKSTVICASAQHIPTFAPYPGSSSEWNKIPLGLGTEGEKVWDVSVSPQALVTGTTGGGKNNSLRVLVETTKGQKKIGELEVGDYVFDPEGNPTRVNHLHAIVTPPKAYEIEFSNGEKIIADPEHLWETETRTARLSRFNSVKKEVKRSHSYWLSEDVKARVEAELEATTNEDTIAITEVAELTQKVPTTGLFFQIAKEIGVAEEVRSQIKVHHKAGIIKQMQTLTYVNSQEFMKAYNSRRILGATVKNPLSLNQFDKLRQLLTEVRNSDLLTVNSVIEYLGGNKFSEQWIRKNFDSTLGTQESVKDLYAKADIVKSIYPDKIFSIDAEYINGRQFASLIGSEPNREISTRFISLTRNVKDKKKVREEVELVRSERITIQDGAPYFKYPKRMFLERILERNAIPLNDQQHKHIKPKIRTTQEIFETLKTEGATEYTNHSIRKAKPLQMPEADLPIQPYSLGAWLGDGSSHHGNVCGIDRQIFENIKNEGYAYNKTILNKIEGKHEDFRNVTFPKLAKDLRRNGLLHIMGNATKRNGHVKHIPEQFFQSSIEQRRELLRGLLDTDGTVKDNGAVQFYTSVPQLRDDAKRLIAGLGYIPNVSSRFPKYEYKGEQLTSETEAFTITFQADPADRLFGIDRKNEVHAERYNHADMHSTADLHYIVNIREVEPEPMRCISVDSPSRLFLVSDSMIATHNSTIQRNIIFHCIQHPDRWRFLGVDVKRVELKPYLNYEPVVMGIATDVPDGVEIIRYACDEMMKRYTMMEDLGVNNFLDLPEVPKALMVMIDETFMFLSQSGIKGDDEAKETDGLKGEASKLIGDIARLGRAAGVHMVLATQRPDATVIYGELKQNLACRIAAGRADSIASQMTLDNDAATRLPGNIKGRGYVQNFGEGEAFQGYFAPQKWIDKWLSGDEAWLSMWAKKGIDLDNVSQEAPTDNKKKVKKSLMRKNDKKVKQIEAPEKSVMEEDAPAKPKKEKKGGLRDKIDAFNAKHAPSADTDDADSAMITKDHNVSVGNKADSVDLDSHEFDAPEGFAAEPLIDTEDGLSNSNLFNIAKSIEESGDNVGKEAFTEPEAPTVDLFSDPFADIDPFADAPTNDFSFELELENFDMGDTDFKIGDSFNEPVIEETMLPEPKVPTIPEIKKENPVKRELPALKPKTELPAIPPRKAESKTSEESQGKAAPSLPKRPERPTLPKRPQRPTM